MGQRITLSGYIHDADNNEAIIGATLYDISQKTGTITNEYGYYSLTLQVDDTISLIISYLGYQPQVKKIFSSKDLRLDIKLDPNSLQLSEVVIDANLNKDNVQRVQMGVINVPLSAIRSLPAIAGEQDLFKVIQLLPGVQSGQEGTTGFFVRGGNLDQNLVQLDEATVYNPNHLFGLFSTFNVNAINHIELIKGGFQAEYGGRLSSIVNIQMKDGDNLKHSVEGGIGLLSDNLTIQGPIQKEKSSFIISGRQSHINLLLKPLSANASAYRFFDINSKLNFILSPKDKIYFSIFKGSDNAHYNAVNSLMYTTDFGNSTATFRWNHLYGNKIFSNTSVIYNDYHLALNTEQNSYYSSLYSGIKDVTATSAFTFIPSAKHTLKAGWAYTYHTLYPAAFSANVPRRGNRISIKQDSIKSFYSNEFAVYLQDEYTLSDKLSFQYGVRIPWYMIRDKTYLYAEPRFTAKWSTTPTASIKTSYTQMNQFLHLIPNATAGIPTDIWIPSSELTKPQSASQLAVGYYQNFMQNVIEASVEVYYKNMNHQALFREGNQLNLNTNIDSSLVYGSGESYGIEFFVKKNTGRLTGWVAYTLARSQQLFDDLNLGKIFPFKYDRRHVLSITGSYDLSKKWNLSSVFVYSSGTPYTLPTGRVSSLNAGSIFEGNYFLYQGRNNARLNPYHRLDLSARYHAQKTLFNKKGGIEWVFGLYNTYSRQNPYFVYFAIDPISDKPIAKQVSLLPIIPSVSFNFKF